MSDFNPREPIRLSDIDNLLEESIFSTSNGANIAEYIRKKRGTAGRVRLQNIFEQVAANIPKPVFNFDIDSSDPNPLPESPQQPDAAIAGTSATQNGHDLAEVAASKPNEPVLTPLVVIQDLKIASPKAAKPNDQGVSNLGRQALLNQYHRTNMAKCELLRQITSSTPKPEAASSLSRISTFTTSISPISEIGSPRISEADRVVPPPTVAAAAPLEMPFPEPVLLLTAPKAQVPPVEDLPPPQILAPCSQAPPETTPRKVVVISTPAMPAAPPSPDVVVPETPSPGKQVVESPKVAHQIQPRKLSVTFNNLKDQEDNESNQNITSDESESPEELPPVHVEDERIVEPVRVEEERPVEPERPTEPEQSSGNEGRPAERPEEHKPEPVNQEESIDNQPPAVEPRIRESPDPPQRQNAESSFVTKSILKDSFSSSQKKRTAFRVSFSQQLVQQREISPAPSIPEAHYLSSDGDDSSDMSDEDDFEDAEFQIVDEVYSDDGEYDPNDIEENYKELVRGDDELDKRMSEIHERIPSPLIDVVDEAPVQWYETRSPRGKPENKDTLLAPATCTKDNKTDLQLVDIITDWDDEDDEEEDKEDQVEAPVPESQPAPIEIPETQRSSTQNTNVTVCNVMDISNMEDSAERLVELPAPPASVNGTLADNSPPRPITPPSQFTDSAKRRFLQENEEALISRLQNELPPPSQPPASPPATPDRVSETLMDIVQSFRDQPPQPAANAPSRKTLVPVKKARRQTTVVDPATNSYFEAVVGPFAQPAAPAAKPTKSNQLTTAQKRKLYAKSNGALQPMVHLNGVLESSAMLRSFKVIVQKLTVNSYPEKLTDSDRAAIEKASCTKPTELLPSSAGAKGTEEKKTEETTKVDSDRPEQPVRQVQTNNGDSDSEQGFAGFDEERQQPKLLCKNGPDKTPETENLPETEPDRVQNAPADRQVRAKRIVRKKIKPNKKVQSKPAETIVETPAETVDELSNERLNANEVPNTAVEGPRVARKKKPKNPPEKDRAEPAVVERSDDHSDERLPSPIEEVQDPPPPVVEVKTKRTDKKKKTTNPDERANSNPSERDDTPTSSERNGEHSDGRSNADEGGENIQPASIPDVPSTESVDPFSEQGKYQDPPPPVVEVKTKRNDKKKKTTNPDERANSNPSERDYTPTSSERNGEHSDGRSNADEGGENLQPASIPDVPSTESVDPLSEQGKHQDPPPPVEEVKTKRADKKEKTRNPDERANSNPAEKDDTPTSSERNGEHSDGMSNAYERGQNLQPASIPDVSSPESVDPLSEQEQIISRRRLDTDVSSENKQTRKGRPRKKAEAAEATSAELPGVLSSASGGISKAADRDAQSLPFKKRKDRIYSDDEPPALEPFGGVIPIVNSNDNLPPLLAPNKPGQSNSKRRKEANRDYHEKYTTEKPEKQSRFYKEDDQQDETWMPSNKKVIKNRLNQQLRNRAEEASERRSKRIAETELPRYRPLTDEEFYEQYFEAQRQEAEKKRRKKKSKTVSSSSERTNTAARDTRKRLPEEVQEPVAAKRNRSDTDGVSSDGQPLSADPGPSAATVSDEASSREKMKYFSWLLKLMQPNGESSLFNSQEQSDMITGGCAYVHYPKERLSVQEHKGIQYYFYVHSTSENYGFLRFVPSAVKKLTKTGDFELKFLILEGNLSIHINGKRAVATSGDFFVLPPNSKYVIENGQEVSLIFMIKSGTPVPILPINA